MRPLTQDDFVPKIAAWTKISRYGMTEDGLLVRYEGPLSDGFPVYVCLYEGWWQVSDACSTISAIAEALPVDEKIAVRIIRKEEKPREFRPKERDSMRNLICVLAVLASIALLAETTFADYGYHYNRRGTGYWRDDSNDGYEYNNAKSNKGSGLHLQIRNAVSRWGRV